MILIVDSESESFSVADVMASYISKHQQEVILLECLASLALRILQ